MQRGNNQHAWRKVHLVLKILDLNNLVEGGRFLNQSVSLYKVPLIWVFKFWCQQMNFILTVSFWESKDCVFLEIFLFQNKRMKQTSSQYTISKQNWLERELATFLHSVTPVKWRELYQGWNCPIFFMRHQTAVYDKPPQAGQQLEQVQRGLCEFRKSWYFSRGSSFLTLKSSASRWEENLALGFSKIFKCWI